MARASFSLYRRPPKGILYCQVFDPEHTKYLPAKSTRTSNRIQARKVAKGFVEGLQSKRNENPKFVEFLMEFWDFETSPYIRAQLLRRPNGLTRSYAKTNHSFIRRFAAPFFKQIHLQDVRTSLLERFLLFLRETTQLAPKSINAIYDAVAIAIREAFRLGQLSSDPTKSIRKLWVPYVEKGIPTSAEIKQLSNLAWADERAKLAFYVAVLCGLRLGEIRALKKDAIGKQVLRVDFSYSPVDGLKSPKNGRSRIVPLPLFLQDRLIRLADRSPHGEPWVFWGTLPGRPVSPNVIIKGFFRALEGIGIEEESRKQRRLTFHSLRHAFNAMLRGALPDEKLRLLTGHLTPAMTDRYDHMTDRDWKVIRGAQDERIIEVTAGGVA